MPSRQSARRLLGAAALRHFSETIEELGGGGGCPLGGPRKRLRPLRPAPGQESLQRRDSAPGGLLRVSAHGGSPRGGRAAGPQERVQAVWPGRQEASAKDSGG